MSTFLGHLMTTLVSLVLVSIATNILKQLFYRDPHRPPVVWHWIPKVGSTVDYGKDPYKFFFKCREKVSSFLVHAQPLRNSRCSSQSHNFVGVLLSQSV